MEGKDLELGEGVITYWFSKREREGSPKENGGGESKDRSVSECCVGSLEFCVQTHAYTHTRCPLSRREYTLVEARP